jgi:hypothetical protein
MLIRVMMVAAAVCAGAGAGAAEPFLSGAEFEAHVTGKTLTYSQFGQTYGVEEYLDGRKVRWAFTDDVCQYGYWYDKGNEICFVYTDYPDPVCWTFWKEDGKLMGVTTGDPVESALTEAERTDTPLTCPGPDVGV